MFPLCCQSVAPLIAMLQVELGAEVGYVIRFEDCTSEKTVIKCPSLVILFVGIRLTVPLQI